MSTEISPAYGLPWILKGSSLKAFKKEDGAPAVLFFMKVSLTTYPLRFDAELFLTIHAAVASAGRQFENMIDEKEYDSS